MNQEHSPQSMTIADWRRARANQGPVVRPINGLRLGLDIDGTITLDPKLFADVATHCRQNGGQVHIVTSRSEASRQATVDELNGYNLPFDDLHFIGEVSGARGQCPHTSLDWYQCYLWQKVDYAKRNGLMHFVDDDPKVLSLFATYAPEIVTTSAVDRVRIADPLYELAVKVVLDAQRGSVSLVQRHLKLGYNRTTRLIDAMSESGIVSPLSEDGVRTIYERYRRTPLYTTIERDVT